MAQIGKIEWSDAPNKEERTRRWQIERAPASGVNRYLCLSGQLVGCRTHFFGRRTIPCLGQLCAACEAGSLEEWHGYLACIKSGTRNRVIVEVRGAVGGAIHDEFCRRRSLRGMVFSLSRAEKRANGKVTIKIETNTANMDEFEESPALRKILCTMWRIDEKYAPDLLLPKKEIAIAKTGTDSADVAPAKSPLRSDQEFVL